MQNPRIGSDYQEDIILLLKSIQKGTFIFPDKVSEKEYNDIRHKESSALRAFIGFGCSFSGKWFGGYARDKNNRNYALNAQNSLLKKAENFKGVIFLHKDYREWEPTNCLIYADPPYKATTKIHGDKFNHEEFWQIIRNWSKDNTVIISEYQAPDDFNCIKEINTKTDISGKSGKYNRVERLFKL